MKKIPAKLCKPKVNGFYSINNRILGEPVFLSIKVTAILDEDHMKVQIMEPSDMNFLEEFEIQTEYYEFWNHEPTEEEWLNG